MADTLIAGMSSDQLLDAIQRFISTTSIGTGLLNPEQTKEFIKLTIDQAVVLPMVTPYVMTAETRNIDMIGISGRQARAPRQGVALKNMISVQVSQNQLVAKKFMYPCEITYETFRENIEGAGLEDSLMGEITKASSTDQEDLMFNGNESISPDAEDAEFLGMNDGLIAIASDDENHSCNIADIGTSEDWKGNFSDMYLKMPSKYRQKALLKFLVSLDDEQTYRNSLTERQTAGGDAALQEGAPVKWQGIPIIGVPVMPKGYAFLLNPKNIAFGIRTNVLVETDKDIFRQVKQYAITSVTDVQFAIDPAVVLAYNATP